MHCSSFEPLLDEYVDGSLAPRERSLVAAHLSWCESCAELLAELRVIDALLLTPRTLEPAANFTFKVMAEARTAPVPRHHRIPALPVLAAYLAFAWTAIGLFFYFARGAAQAALASLRASGHFAGDTFGALAAATAHLFGPNTFGVTAFMSALLLFDAAVAVGLFGYLYVARRHHHGNSQEAV
jgi:anti-sigma factor RsiW